MAGLSSSHWEEVGLSSSRVRSDPEEAHSSGLTIPFDDEELNGWFEGICQREREALDINVDWSSDEDENQTRIDPSFVGVTQEAIGTSSKGGDKEFVFVAGQLPSKMTISMKEKEAMKHGISGAAFTYIRP